MATFEATIIKAVEWLQRQPDGADTHCVAIGLGLTYSHTGGALGLAVDRGLIGWVHAPEGKAHNRRVYYAHKWLPEVNGEASRKPPKGEPGKAVSAYRPRKPREVDWEPGKPNVVVAETPVDMRFRSAEPESIFSGLPFGVYPHEATSAAARAVS